MIKQKARIPSIGRSLSKRFWFLGVAVFCLLNANFSYSQIPQSERDVLISIYNATNGSGWTNNTGWNGAAGTECSWFGVTCIGGNVFGLILPINQLSGTFPDVLAGLPGLADFNVLNNSLTGSLPSLPMTSRTIELGGNQFTGEVPSSYADLSNLAYLGLWNNQLTGPPPDSVLNKSGLDLRTDNAFTNIANMAPSASINQVCSGDPPVCTTVTGGVISVADSDDAAGETVSLVAVASDTDGTVTGQFLVGGSVVASNTQSASISLPDGTTVVTFKATDDDGESSTTTVSITVTAPAPNANVAPSVSISGGNRTIADTDGSAGEAVSFTGTATDSDGTIATTQWLVGGSEVATGTSASISLSNGATVVTFKATDNDGASASTTVTITVEAPGTNVAPSVSISGGNRTIADTDGSAGEAVSFTGNATDSDGTIASTQWLVGGSVVATGTSANISLSDGATVVTFKAIDDDGASSTATVSITVKSYEQIPQSERDVLISIYNATNGSGWTNNTGWNGAAGTECSWFGVFCSGGIVNGLVLHGNQLSGTVPDVLAGLPGLTDFNVLNNSLTGSLPSSFGSAISTVELGGNQFTGEVSASYAALPNLVYLGLWNNQLTGPPPDSVVNKIRSSGDAFIDLRTNNAFTNITNLPPRVLFYRICSGDPLACTMITGGTSTVADTDDAVGETVTVIGIVSDTDGADPAAQWLVGGSVVSTHTGSASISLPDGTTVVTFKAIDVAGESSTASVSITVTAPAPNANVAPSVSISGGNRTIADTDGSAGEAVSFTGTATDSDGTIASTQWLVGGSVVATGTSANISLSDGATVVTFKAIDDDGASSTATVSITVKSYEQIPQSQRDALLSIYNATNGSGWTNNTGWNGAAGTECSWFGVTCIGGNVFGLILPINQLSGTFPDVLAGLPGLADFNVLNNSLTGSLPSLPMTSRTIELGGNQFTGEVPSSYADLSNLAYLGLWNNQLTGPPPDSVLNKSGLDLRTDNAFTNIANMAPSASINQVCSGDPPVCTTVTGGVISVADSDDAAGETVSLVAVASDTDGTVTGQFLVGGSVVASNTQSASISLPDGTTVVTFKATDDDGESSTTTVSITVTAPLPQEFELLRANTAGANSSTHLVFSASVPDGELSLQWKIGPSGFYHDYTSGSGEWGTYGIPYDAIVTNVLALVTQGCVDSYQEFASYFSQFKGQVFPVDLSNVSATNYCSETDNNPSYQDFELLRANTAGANSSTHLVFSASVPDGELSLQWKIGPSGFYHDYTSGSGEWGTYGISYDAIVTNVLALVTQGCVDSYQEFASYFSQFKGQVFPVDLSNVSATNYCPQPTVSINGGDRTIADSDGSAGEAVSFTGTATDSDGTIASTTEWLIEGSVVATGLTPTISLPNGVTFVTFKATDDDGGSSIATVKIIVKDHYIPTGEWPAPYNGVTPDSSWGLEFNNIGTFDNRQRLYSCVRIFTDGLPGSVNGIGQFDVIFTQQFFTMIIKFSNSREFNAIGALNENGELPDCSGKFEATTGVYTDIHQYGNGYYRTTYILTDPDNLIFTLEKIGDLCWKTQTLSVVSCDSLAGTN